MSPIPERWTPGHVLALLGAVDLEPLLSELEGWRLEGSVLVREFELTDFRAALRWLNRVAMLADELDHHPDLLLHGYRHVRVACWTHTVGGVSLLDLVLAKQVDGLARSERIA